MSKNATSIQIFGIRHHGPGSARRLIAALEDWNPDKILIEFPADAQSELHQLARIQIEPPIALVVYEQDNIQQALYYPFARFSPEWQAIQWANRQGLPITAMDLPVSQQLAIRNQPILALLPDKNQSTIQQDPLGAIAQLAGFDDSEQWWEITFEQHTDDLALFDAINELMRALRKEAESSRETLIREAYMRKVLRKAIKENHDKIAIVCGAWHGPALEDAARFKIASDNKILKGLAKKKVKAAWIPWSYPRLAKEGGYGAGIHSPQWYELLYNYGSAAPIHWMVAASQLLRKEGIDSSPAHAQEAVRLAHTLANIREQNVPKLSDLDAAALSVLCEGSPEKMQLIKQQLMLGNKVGHVPENASQVPLQKDLMQLLKTTRLNKYWGKTGAFWIKGTKKNPRGGIDLREATDLMKSQLLYQLQILAIHWGKTQETNANDLGAFKELWLLEWQPEFSLSIIEAAMWGNQVAEAAAKCLLQQQADNGVLALAKAVLLGLKAGLQQSVPTLVTLLKDRAALTRDVQELLVGLPTIIQIIQYGDARKTDVTSLALLLEELTPRLATGLAGVATAIDEEAAKDLMKHILACHRGLSALELPLLEDHWWPAIQKLGDLPGVTPLIKGLAVRLLFDQEKIDLPATSQRLDYALSRGNQPLEIANWIAGFLHGSGLILLHHPALWQITDQWISDMDMDDLQEISPLLRRTFSNFSPGERQRMLQLVLGKTSQTAMQEPVITNHYDAERAAVIAEGVKAWMG